MRNVRKMAAGGGKVPLRRLSHEVAGFAAANGRKEVRKMCGFQRLGAAVIGNVLDLLALLVKERASGGVSGEIAAFTIENDPMVLVAKIANGPLVWRPGH